MTDNENIKALEQWIKNYEGTYGNFKTLGNALNLITRQQTKIDEFMKETAVTTLIDDAVVYTPTLEDYNKFKKKFKSEAVKEFAERVKEKYGIAECIVTVDSADIDNLVKEMVGENNSDE